MQSKLNKVSLRISFNKDGQGREMLETRKTEQRPPLDMKKCKRVQQNESSLGKIGKDKSPKRLEINTKGINTDVVRQNHRKHKTTERTPQKVCSRSHRSISPLSNVSRSKSPILKSPYMDHLRLHSHSNIRKEKKELTKNFSGLDNKSKTNSNIEWRNRVRELEEERDKVKQGALEREEYLQMRLREMDEQNTKLKKVLEVKESIIDEITGKIQLL